MVSLQQREIYSKRYFNVLLKKGSLEQFRLNQRKAIFLLLVSLYSFTAFTASAEPSHTPKRMPIVNAELVGMSTDGLNRIDELMQEHIVLGHRAETRDIFARGALQAAKWAHGRGPGLFSMHDVLGLSEPPKS